MKPPDAGIRSWIVAGSGGATTRHSNNLRFLNFELPPKGAVSVDLQRQSFEGIVLKCCVKRHVKKGPKHEHDNAASRPF